MSEWFEKGLKFECAKCGGCCRGEPGYVWVNPAEIAAMAGFVGLASVVFQERCVRAVKDRMSLVEKSNGDCVFWENGIGCRVYPVRPTQCRTWPFWTENIRSPKEWQQAAEKCPGIGQGRLFRADDIRKRAARAS